MSAPRPNCDDPDFSSKLRKHEDEEYRRSMRDNRRMLHETLKRDGAQRLAIQLREYWAERGILVRTWIEPVKLPSHHGEVYAVRSNLHEIWKEAR